MRSRRSGSWPPITPRPAGNKSDVFAAGRPAPGTLSRRPAYPRRRQDGCTCRPSREYSAWALPGQSTAARTYAHPPRDERGIWKRRNRSRSRSRWIRRRVIGADFWERLPQGRERRRFLLDSVRVRPPQRSRPVTSLRLPPVPVHRRPRNQRSRNRRRSGT